jgi:hypothetical protein
MDDLKPFGYPVDWIKDAELVEIPERARHLLEDYSGISSTELMSHINEVVSKAPTLCDGADTDPRIESKSFRIGTRSIDLSTYQLTFASSIPTRAWAITVFWTFRLFVLLPTLKFFPASSTAPPFSILAAA